MGPAIPLEIRRGLVDVDQSAHTAGAELADVVEGHEHTHRPPEQDGPVESECLDELVHVPGVLRHGVAPLAFSESP